MNYLLIGRTNVGKSSLFNILTGSNSKIIHEESETTQDWHRSKLVSQSNIYIYDTPGIILNIKNKKKINVTNLLKRVIFNIDVFLFVVDYKSIFNPIDDEIIKLLRKYDKEILLIINKFDNPKETIDNDFTKYGIYDVFFLSCSHKVGFKELKNFIKKYEFNYSIDKKITSVEYDYSIAILGKPNAGKSTFLNTLLGYERFLTSTKAGTTTDYVIDDFIYKSNKIKIFDTPGIGRKSKISSKSIDYLAIKKSINQIKKVQSTIILIDSFIGLNRQDKRIIKLLSINAKSLLIVFNKIDLIKNKLDFKKNIISEIGNNIYQVKNVKVFFISALSKKNVLKIIDYIYENNLFNKYNLNTSIINKWLKECSRSNPHPLIDKKKVNFKYGVKIKDSPITINIFCNQAEKINKNYIRYLKNNFNSYFKILNQNIRIIFSKSKNPYRR